MSTAWSEWCVASGEWWRLLCHTWPVGGHLASGDIPIGRDSCCHGFSVRCWGWASWWLRRAAQIGRSFGETRGRESARKRACQRPGRPRKMSFGRPPCPARARRARFSSATRSFSPAYRGFNVPGEDGEMSQLERLVLCLSRKDGKPLWTTPVPSKLPEQEKIRDDHGYASSTPVSDGERVFVFFGKAGRIRLRPGRQDAVAGRRGRRAQRLGQRRLADPARQPGHRQRQRRERVAGGPQQGYRQRGLAGPRDQGVVEHADRRANGRPASTRSWWRSWARCSASTQPRASSSGRATPDIPWYMVPSLVADERRRVLHRRPRRRRRRWPCASAGAAT